MTEEQYKRANTVVFPVLTVIMAYVFLSLVAFIKATPGQVTMASYLQLFSALLAIIINHYQCSLFCYQEKQPYV